MLSLLLLANCTKTENTGAAPVVTKAAKPAKAKYQPSLGKASDLIVLWKDKLQDLEKKKEKAGQ